MTDHERVDVAIVGAGAAGIGVGVALSALDLEIRILERDEIGASFRYWPAEMRCITPSFPSNSFGLTDLNAITPDTSPALSLDREHPSGDEYADYLEVVAEFYELPVETGVEVTAVESRGGPAGAESDEETASECERADAVTAVDGERADAVTAVDGGAIDDPETNGGFVLETHDGPIHSEYVVWAGGQFGTPRTDHVPGSSLCVHTSEVESWADYAAARSADDFLIVGGFESGIDAAVALVEAGRRVRVLDSGEPWAARGPDPSDVLSPYTLERLESVADSDRLQVEGGAVVEEVRRRSDGCFEVDARPADGYELDDGDGTYTVGTRPLLATGFEPTLGPVANLFPRAEGTIRLTDRDESPSTPGLFLAGPAVEHDDVEFCFIYKFRARFPVIAETIGERLGVDTEPLQVYREANMFLDDLSCCEPDLCDC
ncbi:NAD(P)/FAD-dependent oxidoreductase [Natrarchaeobius oligotrophus]|uniref:Thioredoxin reductase-like protein n=1 Tax=Natrarchaeobius chitinivorans TaxID=1679083 RepID=A0A3N6MSQ3_NATCH|nr:NAD(P)/FAD-dependent oxidoreductase [Natrarchaeobius chitinivorans]RQG99351.1 thioredoxin reductase-like protein [Natrarchaeobius chitinivorans]